LPIPQLLLPNPLLNPSAILRAFGVKPAALRGSAVLGYPLFQIFPVPGNLGVSVI
jgi:hypothetical protein